MQEKKDIDGNSVVTLKPFNQLKNDMTYAILMTNNVPTGKNVLSKLCPYNA
jgi:hypothetical protein